MVKQLLFISEFQKFINATKSGKRTKLSGAKIKPSTIENYRNVLKLLSAFEQYTTKELTIAYNTGHNTRVLQNEKRYWAEFYREFSDFLYLQKGCHDNFFRRIVSNPNVLRRCVRRGCELGLWHSPLYQSDSLHLQ